MNSKFTVLVIEDEKNISDFICSTLKANGYKVFPAYSGNEGLTQISSLCPDLVLVDLGLPDLDGLDIIKQLRQWSGLPVIVVSARTLEADKVEALDLGADDYITKPFGTSELLARIRTALRHSNQMSSEDSPGKVYHVNELTINFEARSVTLGDAAVHLTPVEYKIVSYLAQNSGKVVTYASLMQHIWGPYTDDDNKILRVHMANIRRKLEKSPLNPEYISTEVGIGYRMKEDNAESK